MVEVPTMSDLQTQVDNLQAQIDALNTRVIRVETNVITIITAWNSMKSLIAQLNSQINPP